jgi:hypothetical protein
MVRVGMMRAAVHGLAVQRERENDDEVVSLTSGKVPLEKTLQRVMSAERN